MNNINWDNFDFVNEDDFSENEVKGKTKSKKRKWREIESIKENRRFKKQI